MVANKQDVPGAMSVEEIAKKLNLTNNSSFNRNWEVRACSALEGTGVKEGLQWLVQDVAARIYVGS